MIWQARHKNKFKRGKGGIGSIFQVLNKGLRTGQRRPPGQQMLIQRGTGGGAERRGWQAVSAKRKDTVVYSVGVRKLEGEERSCGQRTGYIHLRFLTWQVWNNVKIQK